MELIVYHYPIAADNPYQSLMFKSLRLHDIEPYFVKGGLAGLLKVSAFGKCDVLHLHWTHGPATDKSFIKALIGFAVFQLSLILLKIRQKKIVWTIHNLVNHEKCRVWLDRINSILVGAQANVVLVHGNSSIEVVREYLFLSNKKIHVVHHGNYDGVISSRPVVSRHKRGVQFLFFGIIRPYKGVLTLIDVFGRLNGPHCLHISGRPCSEELKKMIIEKSSLDNRISLSLEFISEKELEGFLGQCDVVVLPYKDVLTSGSLLMALTAGRPVIAPKSGLIPEYVSEECAFLYDPADPDGLFVAISQAVECKHLENMAMCSLQQAQKYRWNDIGAEIAKIYKS